MLTCDAGYKYAAQMDEILADALAKHEISDLENHNGYRSLLRTIETSLTICRGAMRDAADASARADLNELGRAHSGPLAP